MIQNQVQNYYNKKNATQILSRYNTCWAKKIIREKSTINQRHPVFLYNRIILY